MSLDDLQAQLRGALDQQFAALKHQYELSIEEARRDAAMEAEREFTAKLDLARAEFHQARTEWESQLQDLVVAARADAEQCAAQAAAVQQREYEQQLQAQFDQRVELATAAAQRTAALEQESERRRAQNEIQAARESAKAEVDAERERLRQELDAERQRWQQERVRERAQAEQAAQQEREAAQREREAAQQEREAAQQEREAARQQVQQERDSERQQLKQLLVAERQKIQQQVAAEAERARQEIEALTARHQTEMAAAKHAAATAAAAAAATAAKAAAVAPAGSPAGAFDRVLAAVSDLDATHTLGAALDLLLAHTGAVAGRAALFLINGDRLKAWKSIGIPAADVQDVESSIAGKDLLARAIQAGRAVPSSSEVPTPAFARLPADRAGYAVPVMIGGRAVAVLYADSGAKPAPPASAEAIELLARHASCVIALRTAMRTLDVLRGVPADTPNGHADEQSARRFAKLLVSEIKLYNEPAVRAGREQRDLRQRLRTEIDRAQRLYEERVPPGVSARSAYFQQELVQTLADGDATLLGNA
jgi:hypothetical protein